MAHSVNCKLLQSYRRWNSSQHQPFQKDCRKLRVSCANAGPPGAISQFVSQITYHGRFTLSSTFLLVQARMPCLRNSVHVGHSYRLAQLCWVGSTVTSCCNKRLYCPHASLVQAATFLHAHSASIQVCMLHAGMHLMLQASPAQAVGFKKVCSS